MAHSRYIGRFAPSPSGPLHAGSLVCALASYLDAKHNHGQWLLRIEDIDPPRQDPSACDRILHTLRCHGLHWDGELVYQSQRSALYVQTLSQLAQRGLSYPCVCIRKRLRQLPSVYDNHCRDATPKREQPHAIRLHLGRATALDGVSARLRFDDRLQGRVDEDVAAAGDFIIHRKDGLFAYHLAVVVDDIAQRVTHIVRGVDLLPSTAKQMLLTQVLGAEPAKYRHIPVLVDRRGDKLSKQTHACAVDDGQPGENLLRCLQHLQQSPPVGLAHQPVDAILRWAVAHWRVDNIRGRAISQYDS